MTEFDPVGFDDRDEPCPLGVLEGARVDSERGKRPKNRVEVFGAACRSDQQGVARLLGQRFHLPQEGTFDRDRRWKITEPFRAGELCRGQHRRQLGQDERVAAGRPQERRRNFRLDGMPSAVEE